MPKLLHGEIGAVACTEAVGTWNFTSWTAKAVRDSDEWVLNGEKIFCTNSQAANVYVTAARVDGNPMPTNFIVDADTPGVSFGNIEKKLGWNGSNTGTVYFDNVRIPAENLLGNLHEIMPTSYPSMLKSCVGIGAMCVGSAAGAYSKTLSHVKERVVNGTALIDNQSVSDDIARMAMDIQTSRALVYRTAALIDASTDKLAIGHPLEFLCSACKVQPPEMASRVCDTAVQLHGGSGYMTDTGIHRYWRDNRATLIGEGPTFMHLAAMANVARSFDLF